MSVLEQTQGTNSVSKVANSVSNGIRIQTISNDLLC